MGCKKQGHRYSKREETAWPLLFLNNNGPVFCTLLLQPIFWTLFFRVTNRPMFSNKNNGCRLNGQLCAYSKVAGAISFLTKRTGG